MNDTQNNLLFYFIHDYLKIYLPKHRNASSNTVRSYRKSLEALLDYAKEQMQLPLGCITFEHLTVDLIMSFIFLHLFPLGEVKSCVCFASFPQGVDHEKD